MRMRKVVAMPFLALTLAGAATGMTLAASERKTPAREATQALRDAAFLGHAEWADLLDAMDVMDAAVALDATAPQARTGLARARFQQAAARLPALGKLKLGMSEPFLFAAMYQLFEDQDPAAALASVSSAGADPRLDPKLDLLAAFVSHLFLDDLPAAAKAYQRLAVRPGAPAFFATLAGRLAAGEDPARSDPRVRASICALLRNAFPRALERSEATRNACAEKP